MGTHYKGSLKEENALNSYIKLARAYESINSRLYMRLATEGLTESQFFALDVLYHLGPMNQKNLGSKLSRSEGNITMVVNNLEKQNLIKKKQSNEDKRVYIIKLKNEGRKLYEKVFPIFLKSIMKDFDGIKEKEQIEFQEVCKRIGLKTP